LSQKAIVQLQKAWNTVYLFDTFVSFLMILLQFKVITCSDQPRHQTFEREKCKSYRFWKTVHFGV